MKNKGFIGLIIAVIIICLVAVQGISLLVENARPAITSQSVSVRAIGSAISASGTIHSENEATLHFATAGKLVYLPFKEGDHVVSGQTIAQLDTYQLQQELTAALNNYKAARDSFDQTQENAGNGVLQNAQTSQLNPNSLSGLSGNGQATAINNAIARIVDENQANLNNAVINVQLANYALQLSTLTAPFSGVITQEDVTVANQNVTPATGFSLADPSNLVFRANVDASDIDYVHVGAQATLQIDGYTKPVTATVTKIYPDKQTLGSGEEVYQVDLQGDSLQQIGKLGQSGSVLINSSAAPTTVSVPTWTILGHNSIWVEENNKAILKSITVGPSHGDTTEVLHGIAKNDKVITNPLTIIAKEYAIL